MQKQLPLIIPFFAVFFLSILSLSIAALLSWWQKDSVIYFLLAAAFFSLISAVVGTTGKVSISDFVYILSKWRSP